MSKIGSVKDGWVLKMIAHSPVETFDPEPLPTPIFEGGRFQKQPPRSVVSPMIYTTIAGVGGYAGQGVVQKERTLSTKEIKKLA